MLTLTAAGQAAVGLVPANDTVIFTFNAATGATTKACNGVFGDMYN